MHPVQAVVAGCRRRDTISYDHSGDTAPCCGCRPSHLNCGKDCRYCDVLPFVFPFRVLLGLYYIVLLRFSAPSYLSRGSNQTPSVVAGPRQLNSPESTAKSAPKQPEKGWRPRVKPATVGGKAPAPPHTVGTLTGSYTRETRPSVEALKGVGPGTVPSKAGRACRLCGGSM